MKKIAWRVTLSENSITKQVIHHSPQKTEARTAPGLLIPGDALGTVKSPTLPGNMHEMENRIKHAPIMADGNIARTAELLDGSRPTLYAHESHQDTVTLSTSTPGTELT